MSRRRRPARDRQPADRVEEGDVAVLGREDGQDLPSWRPRHIERGDWRGEGVVSSYHTD